MEQRANGSVTYAYDHRSCDDNHPLRGSRTNSVLSRTWRVLTRCTHPSADERATPRQIPAVVQLVRRSLLLGPLIACSLASLLGCASPAAFPALLPVWDALPEGINTLTPVLASSLAMVRTPAPEASVLTATPAADATAEPEEAPEAGRHLAAVPAPRRTLRPLASVFAALANAVEREVRAQVPAITPTAPAAERMAVAEVASSPPERICSAAIDLDIEIVPVGWKQVERDGKTVSMWEVGSFVASWHKTSAMPGQVGNMVITGHNNIEGSVFRRLPDLREGDEIAVEAGGRPYTYTVETKFVVQEKDATPEQKRWNGQWIGHFADERLTLVTCYPPDGNSHRLIVIAKPARP
jgi:LPXTG-site transpeptidase (sortase) family protein